MPHTPSKALAVSAAKQHTLLLTPEHKDWGVYLMAARHFQTTTSGHENLITRLCDPDVLVLIYVGKNIVATSEGHHFEGDLYEMARVLVHPSYRGQNLNKMMQDAHTAKAHNDGRHCLFFTRPDDDKRDKIISQQTQRGWIVLPPDHPFFRCIEKTKTPRPDLPPKLCFMSVARGTDLALTLSNDRSPIPAAPAATLAP